MADFTQEDVVRVAEGLTKAQREALLSAFDSGLMHITKFESFRSARALHRIGLTNLQWSPSGLTPLGLAVRNHLLEQAHD